MSYKVVAEDLTAHGSHLDGLVDRLDTAISAAETASMSEDAYGLLCSFMPPIINPMEQDGMDALKAAKEGVTHTADNIRTTAKQYQETDEDNSASFDPLLENQQSAPTGPQMSGSAPGGTEPTLTDAQQGEPAHATPTQPTITDAQQGEPAHATPTQPTITDAQQGEPAHATPTQPTTDQT